MVLKLENVAAINLNKIYQRISTEEGRSREEEIIKYINEEAAGGREKNNKILM